MRLRVPGYTPRGRYVRAEDVPFKELLPLKLRTSVSAKGEKKGGAQCIQEMSVLFACLKSSNFEEKHCNKELESFQRCVTLHETADKTKKEVARRGELDPSEKTLSHHQVSALLKLYPH